MLCMHWHALNERNNPVPLIRELPNPFLRTLKLSPPGLSTRVSPASRLKFRPILTTRINISVVTKVCIKVTDAYRASEFSPQIPIPLFGLNFPWSVTRWIAHTHTDAKNPRTLYWGLSVRQYLGKRKRHTAFAPFSASCRKHPPSHHLTSFFPGALPSTRRQCQRRLSLLSMERREQEGIQVLCPASP